MSVFIVILIFVVILALIYFLWKAHEEHKEYIEKYGQLITGYNAFETGTATNNFFIKYGGLQTVQAVVDLAVTNLLAEPTLASVFAVVGQPLHRSGVQLKSCLDLQFSALLGMYTPYPGRTFTRGVIVDARTMKASHAALTITSAQFNTFVTILANTLLQAGVAQADVNALAPGLEAMMTDIVTVK